MDNVKSIYINQIRVHVNVIFFYEWISPIQICGVWKCALNVRIILSGNGYGGESGKKKK